VSTGYGYVALATAPAGGASPVNRLGGEEDGNVGIGNQTSLYVPGGEENVRIMRGVINPNGTVLAGQGVGCTGTAIGTYRSTINTPFPRTACVVATVDHTLATGTVYAEAFNLASSGTSFVDIRTVNPT